MKITIQNYAVSGGAATLGQPRVLVDEKAGITLADLDIDGRKLVQAAEGVRARQIEHLGRGNRSTQVAFVAEEKHTDPATAGAKILAQQEALSDAVYQVLTMVFQWSGTTLTRYWGGSLAQVRGRYIVGCAIQFQYVFAAGAMSFTVPAFPSSR